ncbi:MAG: GatB/YqeY domain-containing protein [Chloroflexia bacterium]|nr:GatB/YqeY domain-containing protein [Chloroflexia bacterium]
MTMADVTTRQRLEDDLKVSMRAGDTTTRDAIRYLLAAVKNAEIDARGTGAAADADAALRKVAKQLADAIDQYRAAGRDDLADHEQAQLEVLKRYLPQEISDEALQAVVDAAIAETAATGPKDMGRVMPVVLAKTAGQADGRRVSGAVRDALGRL